MAMFSAGMNNARLVAGLPELRVFWALLPFLVGLLILNLVYLPAPINLVAAAVILAVGAVAGWTSVMAAKTNLRTVVERNELKSVVFGLADALVVYDQNFRISYFNPAAESLFDLKRDEILEHVIQPQNVEDPRTKLLAQVIFPSLAPTLVTRTKAGEFPQVSDLSFSDPELELRVVTAPVADDAGRLLGFMKIVRNRTREVTLLRSKEEFITVASHQLRTPITELVWALEAAGKDEGLSPDTKNLLEHAHGSAEKVKNLVEDLLAISKIEEGRFGYEFHPADLVKWLDTSLAEYLPRAEHAGVRLYFDRPKEPLPQVVMDPQKLGMVLSNLIDNAIRYNVPNGTITVAARRAEKGPYLEVSVKDTGIGVPADEMDRLFTKFYRSTNALKFQTEGSGLGLYIARNIVRAHGGQMWGESELNRGSTFAFTLPTDATLVPTKEVGIE